MSIGSGAHKKDGGGTRGPGTKRGAENAACRDDSTDQLAFEKFGDKVRNSHGRPAEKVEDSLLAKHADAAAGFEEIPEVLGSGLVDCRRGDSNKLGEDAGEMNELRRGFYVFGGIPGRKTRHAKSRPGPFVP